MKKKNQKIFFICIGVVMILMLLFQPFQLQLRGPNSFSTKNMGYHFIFVAHGYEYGTVNLGLLFVQWLIVGSIAFVGWLIFNNKK